MTGANMPALNIDIAVSLTTHRRPQIPGHRPIYQKVYSFVFEILRKCCVSFVFVFMTATNQFGHSLLMSWQLRCRDISKIVAWSDFFNERAMYNQNYVVLKRVWHGCQMASPGIWSSIILWPNRVRNIGFDEDYCEIQKPDKRKYI